MSFTPHAQARRTAAAQAWARNHEAMVGRFGLRLAGQLNRSAESLPHDISERLRVAREQSVGRARQVRSAAVVAAAQSVQVQGQGSATLSGPPSIWLRLAAALPLTRQGEAEFQRFTVGGQAQADIADEDVAVKEFDLGYAAADAERLGG